MRKALIVFNCLMALLFTLVIGTRLVIQAYQGLIVAGITGWTPYAAGYLVGTVIAGYALTIMGIAFIKQINSKW